jgi:hypothetical protein
VANRPERSPWPPSPRAAARQRLSFRLEMTTDPLFFGPGATQSRLTADFEVERARVDLLAEDSRERPKRAWWTRRRAPARARGAEVVDRDRRSASSTSACRPAERTCGRFRPTRRSPSGYRTGLAAMADRGAALGCACPSARPRPRPPRPASGPARIHDAGAPRAVRSRVKRTSSPSAALLSEGALALPPPRCPYGGFSRSSGLRTPARFSRSGRGGRTATLAVDE